MSESRMVTLASVARRVNRTPQTLLRWADAGEFPHSVLLNGRSYLFENDVAAWLDRTRASTARRSGNPCPCLTPFLGDAAMGDFGPSLALCRMYQRTSKKGATYYAGRMGMASIVLLKTDETSESGQPVWVFKVSEPAPKSDARDLSRRPDEEAATAAKRGFARAPDDDGVPF